METKYSISPLSCTCCEQKFSRRHLLAGLASSGSALALAATDASGQELWTGELNSSCSFYDDIKIDDKIYTFKSSQEANDIISKITDVIGLPANFRVMVANVPNAAAVIKGTDRYILYSEAFIQEILSASSEWAAWTIMAHEVGHHLSGHTLTATGSRPPLELQADRFAGFAVGRMGATLPQAHESYQKMSDQGSETHPPRRARLEAVATGWKQAQSTTPRPTPQAPPNPQTPTQPNPQPTLPAGVSTLNPVQVLAWIIQAIATNNLDTNKLAPNLQPVYQQQRLNMAQAMQFSGQIMNINLMNSTTGNANDTIFYFNVQFQNGFRQFQLGLRQDGAVTHLYFT